jgi:F420-dependent oxidoreductase-like protein
MELHIRTKETTVKIGLQVPDFTTPGGPMTLGPDFAALVRTADDVGFDVIAVMDHLFQIGMVGPPEDDMLEAYTALSFAAAHTSRAKLLALVTAVVYRHPGVLMKQVSTLDVLSGGRAMLGIGAAWNEEEARGLGIPFPPITERFERLEEALQIAHRMFSGSEEPFVGKHYQLERPLNHPAPLVRPPIMVGGSGEKKTLRLVARYADACNLFPTPHLAHKLEVLREHCEAENRDYETIQKTALLQIDLDQGTDTLLAQLQDLSDLGIELVIAVVKDVWKVRPLEVIGNEVIPAVAAF